MAHIPVHDVHIREFILSPTLRSTTAIDDALDLGETDSIGDDCDLRTASEAIVHESAYLREAVNAMRQDKDLLTVGGVESIRKEVEASVTRAAKRVNDAYDKLGKRLDKLTAQTTLPPEPKTPMAVALMVHTLDRLTRLQGEARHAFLSANLASGNQHVYTAVIHGAGLHDLSGETVARWQSQYGQNFHPHEFAQLQALRKGKEAFDRLWSAFTDTTQKLNRSPLGLDPPMNAAPRKLDTKAKLAAAKTKLEDSHERLGD